MHRTYLCIDLKSFFASVECVERGLDPLNTNLVVADGQRTEKTICLAVTPSLKAYGLSGRARLFEVVQTVSRVNGERRWKAPNRQFSHKSFLADEIQKDPSVEVDYIVASPRMAYYMEYSTRIYNIYLKYVSKEDILVYSIDEVFIDLTNYLSFYQKSPHKLALTIIRDVLSSTGITATAGIGTNLYLAKIAMDIKAKKMPADCDGVRIAQLDEQTYRKELWHHQPLTDFWRVGAGTARRLASKRMFTMGDVARMSRSSHGRQTLKKLLGINARLLIDHAWGYEPATIREAKSYVPENQSLSSGQVLHCPYDFEKARIIVREMTEQMSLSLVEKKLCTNQIVLTVGYDTESLSRTEIKSQYHGEITTDFYGRKVPKHAHHTVNLEGYTSSGIQMTEAVLKLYDSIVHPALLIRRITLAVNHILREDSVPQSHDYEQINFLTDYDAQREQKAKMQEKLSKERALQETTIRLRHRFGKNAILKGTNLQEGATTIDRNRQIGGHKA